MKHYRPNGSYVISSGNVEGHISSILKGQLIMDTGRMMSGHMKTEIKFDDPSIVDVMLIVAELIIARDRHNEPIPENLDEIYGKLLSKIVTNTIKMLDKNQ